MLLISRSKAGKISVHKTSRDSVNLQCRNISSHITMYNNNEFSFKQSLIYMRTTSMYKIRLIEINHNIYKYLLILTRNKFNKNNILEFKKKNLKIRLTI